MDDADLANLDIVCEFVGDDGALCVSLSPEENGSCFGYGFKLDRCRVVALRGLLDAALEATEETYFSVQLVGLNKFGARDQHDRAA